MPNNDLRRSNSHKIDRLKLEELKNYIRTGTLPERIQSLHVSGQYRYRTNYKGWRIRGNDLLTDIGLIVIPKEDVDSIIKDHFEDPKTGRRNVDSLYNMISKSYCNITKKDIKEFLNRQASYQITKKQARGRVSRPIITADPKERYQIDFIVYKDLSRQNSGYKYIFNCVDCFSKYICAYPTKKRTMEAIIEGMDFCIDKMGIPDFIQGDNEFSKKEFIEYLKQTHDIKFIASSPYTPQSNGLIERMNRTLKGILNLFFEQRNNKRWVDILPDIVQNINNTAIRSLLMHTPLKVHSLGDSVRDRRLILKIWKNQFKDKVNVLEKYNIDNTLPEVFVNDSVRIQIEKILKAKGGAFIKRDRLRWSKNIFTVETIFNTEWGTRMYLLSNNRTYKRDQILKVERPDSDISTEAEETEPEVQLSEDLSTQPGSEPEDALTQEE